MRYWRIYDLNLEYRIWIKKLEQIKLNLSLTPPDARVYLAAPQRIAYRISRRLDESACGWW